MNKNFWPIALISFVVVVGMTIGLYLKYIADTKHEELTKHQMKLSSELDAMIDEKLKVTLAMSMTISENNDFKSALKLNQPPDESIKPMIQKLKDTTGYENLWLQLIGADGKSIYRSWTDKKGDDLLKVRKDLRQVFQYPQPMTSFSVGKFTLSFKAIVPLYDDSNFIGVVEILTQINSIDREMRDRGIESIMLVNPMYRSQLTKAWTQTFIDDYYVANTNFDQSLITFLQKNDFTDWLVQSRYIQIEDKTLSIVPVLNVENQNLGYWVFFQQNDEIELIFWQEAKKKVLIAAVAIIALFLLVLLLIYYRQAVLIERHFFHDIFDGATEIIFVQQGEKIVQANKAFFDLFKGVGDIDGFALKHGQISQLFLEEDGFIQPEVDGQPWVEYVLHNRSQQNYVKLAVGGEALIMLLKVVKVNHEDKDFYSVIMSDMTLVEDAKRKLEWLSVTDSLTSTFNRFYFNKRAYEEIQKAHGADKSLSFVMFDLDNFRKINEKFGQDVGDEVLKILARTLQSLLPESFPLCRVGGEEFIIILPEHNINYALEFSEALRSTVSEIDKESLPRQVTISIGVVELQSWETLNSMYKRLEQSMLASKLAGRNRVTKG